jgi:hypothetical protein
LGPKYDQETVDFLKVLLLLSLFEALLLGILKRRTFNCITQVHTSKQVQEIRNSTPNKVNSTK